MGAPSSPNSGSQDVFGALLHPDGRRAGFFGRRLAAIERELEERQRQINALRASSTVLSAATAAVATRSGMHSPGERRSGAWRTRCCQVLTTTRAQTEPTPAMRLLRTPPESPAAPPGGALRSRVEPLPNLFEELCATAGASPRAWHDDESDVDDDVHAQSGVNNSNDNNDDDDDESESQVVAELAQRLAHSDKLLVEARAHNRSEIDQLRRRLRAVQESLIDKQSALVLTPPTPPTLSPTWQQTKGAFLALVALLVLTLLHSYPASTTASFYATMRNAHIRPS